MGKAKGYGKGNWNKGGQPYNGGGQGRRGDILDFAEDFGRMMSGVAALGQMTSLGQLINGAGAAGGPRGSGSPSCTSSTSQPLQPPNTNGLSNALVDILSPSHHVSPPNTTPPLPPAAPQHTPQYPAQQTPLMHSYPVHQQAANPHAGQAHSFSPNANGGQLLQGVDRQTLEDAIAKSSAFQSLSTRVSGMETQVSQQGDLLGVIRTRQEADSGSLFEILQYIRREKGAADGVEQEPPVHQAAGLVVPPPPAAGAAPVLPVLAPVLGRMPANHNDMTEMLYEFHVRFCIKMNCSSNKETKFATWEGDDAAGIPIQEWLSQISKCKSKSLWRNKLASLGCNEAALAQEEDVTKIVKMGVVKFYTELNTGA
eukprot:TRINITY_DN17899_c0_g1_i1.p1 TRINITY_DN17899_c0_g1~~TRINITY_DN17899_c0_g1_i1.p1  ORF type:complete len:419 (-),score=66.16 TRINITY_DN17899_c0_g1_i1:1233-2339(-)